ncbi:MAG: hypothetical protein QXH94_05880 [Sulfolobales archaeon]
MKFIQLFLLLSTITITTYGAIFHDIVAIEGGFKAAIVLLAYNAVTQSIRVATVTALSVLVLLILFYSTHLYLDIIEHMAAYSVMCLLIFALYNPWKQNRYRRRIKAINFEAVALLYVVISSAWVTIEERVIWVITLATVVAVFHKVLLPRTIKILGIFGPLSLSIRFEGLFKEALNIPVRVYSSASLKFSRAIKCFCEQMTSLPEIGERLDRYLMNKSTALLKFMSKEFLEIENDIVKRFHMISLAIERFQYIVENTFVLLLFLASMFVLIAILAYTFTLIIVE